MLKPRDLQYQTLAVFSALIGAAQRAVILVLADEPKTMKEIILGTGQSRSSVLRVMRSLQRKCLVVADGKPKSKRRRYRLVRVAFGQAADCLLAFADARLDAQDMGIKGKHDGKAIERLAKKVQLGMNDEVR